MSWKGEWKTTFSMHTGSYWPDFELGIQNGFFRNGILLLAGKGEWKTKFSVHIGSNWPDFKFGVQIGVCRNAIFFNWKEEFCLLQKKAFFCLVAPTGPILYLGFKMAFVRDCLSQWHAFVSWKKEWNTT